MTSHLDPPAVRVGVYGHQVLHFTEHALHLVGHTSHVVVHAAQLALWVEEAARQGQL